MSDKDIQSLLQESRLFKPSKAFQANANFQNYQATRKAALENPEKFWSEIASDLHWFKKWEKVLDWKLPDAKWFIGGKTNIAYNCLDRHIETRGNKTALIWEGEPGEKRQFTFKELHREVCRFGNVLKSLDIQSGDRVMIYMPMTPEAVIAMLGCARIGAVHS